MTSGGNARRALGCKEKRQLSPRLGHNVRAVRITERAPPERKGSRHVTNFNGPPSLTGGSFQVSGGSNAHGIMRDNEQCEEMKVYRWELQRRV